MVTVGKAARCKNGHLLTCKECRRASWLRYARSEKGRQARDRYRFTAKGQLSRIRNEAKRRRGAADRSDVDSGTSPGNI